VRDRREHARLRRGDLDVHLVGLELDERLARRDLIAGLLQPAGHARVDDGLPDFRHKDVHRHRAAHFSTF
jgi:hypothetical protein